MARPTDLKTLDDIRLELGKVYRDTKAGTLALPMSRQLAYLLQVLASVVKDSDLEARLEALEKSGSLQ